MCSAVSYFVQLEVQSDIFIEGLEQHRLDSEKDTRISISSMHGSQLDPCHCC